MLKAIVAKITASGEQLNFEVSDGKPERLAEKLAIAMRLADNRLWEMNQRIVKSNEKLKELAKTSPEVYMLVQQIFSILFGQDQPAPARLPEEEEVAVEAEAAQTPVTV